MNNGNGVLTNVQNWVEHPFNSNGSALNWILFVGLFMIAGFLWHTVILMITDEI
jgi:hypothetical protein